MFTISVEAAAKAHEVLKAEGKEGWGLRIFLHGEGCCGPSYGLDIDEKASEDDEIIEENGLRVFVNKDISKDLDNKQFDFVKTQEGEGFVINSKEPLPECGPGCTSCG
jgi:iron-sulfur cluster assembly accessory protein